jgi:hypothetical protein
MSKRNKRTFKIIKEDVNPLANFNQEDLQQLVHFSQNLFGGVTDFDEEVERELELLEAEKAQRRNGNQNGNRNGGA